MPCACHRAELVVKIERVAPREIGGPPDPDSLEVYTAEKSPHGFYWARAAGGARALRGV
ncbi:MAG: hypothetical protein ACKO3G_06280 [Planctomycetaceae bacterium]